MRAHSAVHAAHAGIKGKELPAIAKDVTLAGPHKG